MTDSVVIEFDNVRKTYGTGQAKVEALAGIDLQVREGEFVAVMGPSGS
jgi:putative ABC transport system ATP-binding protein